MVSKFALVSRFPNLAIILLFSLVESTSLLHLDVEAVMEINHLLLDTKQQSNDALTVEDNCILPMDNIISYIWMFILR